MMARETFGAAPFSDEQLAYLRYLLTPRCCHVSGEHDPTHFENMYSVCRIQKSEAFDMAREALGFGIATPQEATPKDDCGWCKRIYGGSDEAAAREPGDG